MTDNNTSHPISTVFIFLVVFFYIGALISPVFIPLFRKYYNKKYENFEHKDLLVQEEMHMINTYAIITFVISWTLLILANI